jgi:alpha-1,3-glucan synthase
MGLLWPGIIRTFPTLLTAVLLFRPISIQAHEYRPDLAQWNLNENQEAGTNVLEYSTSRPSANYTPSPANWRQLPFYSLLLDKYADGDPSNNDFFNSTWENDANEVNLRYGGDIRGLERHLDYIQGMGMRGIYIAGTPFLNMPWQADSE